MTAFQVSMTHIQRIRTQLVNQRDANPAHLNVALSYLGVREGRDDQQIVEFFQSTRYRTKTSRTPWCAAYVCWCLEQAGVTSTKSARAADFATWGDGCPPRMGAVVVLGKTDPDAGGSGHVAFWVGEDDEGGCYLLGGNQRNTVSIARRPASRIVAIRWPAQYPLAVGHQ